MKKEPAHHQVRENGLHGFRGGGHTSSTDWANSTRLARGLAILKKRREARDQNAQHHEERGDQEGKRLLIKENCTKHAIKANLKAEENRADQGPPERRYVPLNPGGKQGRKKN